jgi:hypothetical protein
MSRLKGEGGHVNDLRLEGKGCRWCKDEMIKTAFETELSFYEKALNVVA